MQAPEPLYINVYYSIESKKGKMTAWQNGKWCVMNRVQSMNTITHEPQTSHGSLKASMTTPWCRTSSASQLRTTSLSRLWCYKLDNTKLPRPESNRYPMPLSKTSAVSKATPRRWNKDHETRTSPSNQTYAHGVEIHHIQRARTAAQLKVNNVMYVAQ